MIMLNTNKVNIRISILFISCLLFFSCDNKSIHVSSYDKVSTYSSNTFGPGLHYEVSVYEGKNIDVKNVQINWFNCNNITSRYDKLIEKYTNATKNVASGEVAIAYGDVWHSFFIKLRGEFEILIEITEWDDHLSNTDYKNFNEIICIK